MKTRRQQIKRKEVTTQPCKHPYTTPAMMTMPMGRRQLQSDGKSATLGSQNTRGSWFDGSATSPNLHKAPFGICKTGIKLLNHVSP